MSRIFWFVFTFGCLTFTVAVPAQVNNNAGQAMPRQNVTQLPTRQLPANQQSALQQAATQQPVNQRAVAVANLPVAGQPIWHPLPAEHEKRLIEILKYWEWQASQVQRYRCKFTRWEYDPIKLPNHPQIAATISKGSIQYATPDKGLFKVEQIWDVAMETQKVIDQNTGQERQITQPALKDNREQHVARKEIFGEHWICDGKSIFEVNAREKKIFQRTLPPDMQGKQITQGPLPFLFGAKVDTMRAQYWIREVVPQPIPEKIMLEAIPKRPQEAADFKEIRIVIDDKEWLPEALLLFHRGGGRSNYEFAVREKNWSILPEKLNPFHQQFFAPKLPNNEWKLVTEPFEPMPAAQAPPPAIGNNARPPAVGTAGGSSLPPRQAVRSLPPTGKKR